MGYETFIPQVWSASLQRELEKKFIFAKHTNREYEGDVKQKGDSVRILNVGKPTIHSTTLPSGKSTIHGNLATAEEIDNSSITMPIQQIRYFNYFVGDIDKAQMQNDGKVLSAYQKETVEGMNDEIDIYLGQTVFLTAPTYTNAFSNATYKYIKVTAGDSDSTPAPDDAQNVLEILDDVVQKARENDIPDTTLLYVACSPKFEKLVRKALIGTSTDNVEIIEGKSYLKYYNLRIEWSNNVKKVDAVNGQNAAYEYVTIRTENAIAFVNPFTHTEAYRPEKGFADALKGYTLFDGMVVRPNEIFNVLVTY